MPVIFSVYTSARIIPMCVCYTLVYLVTLKISVCEQMTQTYIVEILSGNKEHDKISDGNNMLFATDRFRKCFQELFNSKTTREWVVSYWMFVNLYNRDKRNYMYCHKIISYLYDDSQRPSEEPHQSQKSHHLVQ